jgi:hypothetical protein
MSPTSGASASQQWLVQGKDVASGSLFSHIGGDPNVRQIRRIAQDIVVLSMSPEQAAQLQARFGRRLVIEPNADLIPPV